MGKLFIAYDGRALYDVDEASVLVATTSKREAVEMAKEYGGAAYSYDDDGTPDLTNEQLIYPTLQDIANGLLVEVIETNNKLGEWFLGNGEPQKAALAYLAARIASELLAARAALRELGYVISAEPPTSAKGDG